MYYDYTKINSYNAPINIILSRRGLGKTFTRVLSGIRDAFEHDKMFIYVVETREMVKELARNRGDKFFIAVINYLKNSKSKRNQKLLKYIENGTILESSDDIKSNIIGSTITIGGKTAGYIVALNDFSNLKRNNFDNVATVIVDEFIPEKRDIRTLQNPRKLVSIIQSIARLRGIKVYMLANTICLVDPILTAFGLTNLKIGEWRFLKDEYGLLAVCHYVDNKDYEEFKTVADKSVAGRLAKLLKLDNLDKNEFNIGLNNEYIINDNIMPSSFVCCFHCASGSIRMHVTKDHNFYYMLYDYGNNTRNRFCFDKKYISPTVRYNIEFKDILTTLYENKRVKFDAPETYYIFCDLLGVNV